MNLFTIINLMVSSSENKVLTQSCGNKAFIAFRGTQNWNDVLHDLDLRPRRWPSEGSTQWVHGGFARMTESVLPEVESVVRSHDTVVLGGHSLGATCAVLAASWIQQRENACIEEVITFGSPPLATPSFREFYRGQGLDEKTFNFYTTRDPIVRVPRFYRPLGSYVHLPCNYSSLLQHHDLQTYHRLIRDLSRAQGFEEARWGHM